MKNILFLLRHGETEWNRSGRYQGRSDPELTPNGETQARKVAEHLARQNLAAIVVSPLRRAYVTASIVAERLGLPITTDERLVEMGYGDWEGLQQAEIKTRWPELLRRWKKAPDEVAPPGGESLSDLQRRVRSFLQDTAAGPGPILAVTHAGVIRAAVLEIRREPLGKFRQVQIANGSLTAIHWQDGRLSLADGPWVGEDGIYSRICTDPERSGNQLKDDLGA